MARRRKKQSAATKSFKKKVRRERKPKLDPKDLTWLSHLGIERAAMKVLNPRCLKGFWLSIPKENNPPVSHFYPCELFSYQGRTYYGFAFLEHRDEQVIQWYDRGARRELVSTIQEIRKT